MTNPTSTPDAPAPDLRERVRQIIRQTCYLVRDVGICGVDDAAVAILAALRAERDEAQPVAWQYRRKGDVMWETWGWPSKPESGFSDLWEMRPLYAYPPATSSIDEAQPVADLDWRLPCDVRLPPVTTIKRGVNLRTLIVALQQREKWAAQGDDISFGAHPPATSPVLRADCGCSCGEDGIPAHEFECQPCPNATSPGAAGDADDRAALRHVLQDLEITSHQCETCGAADPCADMDIANWLRDYLAKHPAPAAMEGDRVRAAVHQGVTEHSFLMPEQRDSIVASVLAALRSARP